MSRVKAVVGNSIMVNLEDLVPGDILYVTDTENDPIISRVEREGTKYRLWYKEGFMYSGPNPSSAWMDTSDEFGDGVLIHDLKRERFEFLEEVGESCAP